MVRRNFIIGTLFIIVKFTLRASRFIAGSVAILDSAKYSYQCLDSATYSYSVVCESEGSWASIEGLTVQVIRKVSIFFFPGSLRHG